MNKRRPERIDSGFESRNLALNALLKIEGEDGYANLVLPAELRRFPLEARDAAFVTELVYGTLRKQIFYDKVIESASQRKIGKIDRVPLNILRMTAHQLLTLETPPHAAVDSAVRLVVRNKSGSASGFVNAISRRISEKSTSFWIELLSVELEELEKLSLEYAHPRWIVEKYLERLGDLQAVTRELAANNVNPRTTGVIYPGEQWSKESLSKSQESQWSRMCRYLEGNPEHFEEIRKANGGVQDQGSFLVAQALFRVATERGSSLTRRRPWLDLCAGPGGKAALLSRWAEQSSANFLALEISEHRAGLLTRMTDRVVIADSVNPPIRPGSASIILLDAPCSGLGALRRRPDARHRKKPEELAELISLQRRLMVSATDLLSDDGILGYVTCSPLREETTMNTRWLLDEKKSIELLDARMYMPEGMELEKNFDVQLWPGIHGTDAMYLALFRKKPSKEIDGDLQQL